MAHLVLYDGNCGMCRRFVDWAKAKNADGDLQYVPFQTAPSPPMTPQLREACAKAVHVVAEDGHILRAGRASLFVLARTTRPWRAFAAVFRFPPLVWGVEVGYRLVARNRMFFSRFILPRRA